MSRTSIIVFVAVMFALPMIVDSYWLNMLTLALIYSLAVFSINFLTGLDRKSVV